MLKDALGRKERLEKLEGMSEKFDDTSVPRTLPLFFGLCCACQACAGQLRSTFAGLYVVVLAFREHDAGTAHEEEAWPGRCMPCFMTRRLTWHHC